MSTSYGYRRHSKRLVGAIWVQLHFCDISSLCKLAKMCSKAVKMSSQLGMVRKYWNLNNPSWFSHFFKINYSRQILLLLFICKVGLLIQSCWDIMRILLIKYENGQTMLENQYELINLKLLGKMENGSCNSASSEGIITQYWRTFSQQASEHWNSKRKTTVLICLQFYQRHLYCIVESGISFINTVYLP